MSEDTATTNNTPPSSPAATTASSSQVPSALEAVEAAFEQLGVFRDLTSFEPSLPSSGISSVLGAVDSDDVKGGEEDGLQKDGDEKGEEAPAQDAKEVANDATDGDVDTGEDGDGDSSEEEGCDSKEESPSVFYKALKDGKDFELPEDVVFKFKVNGEDQEVTIPQLVRNYQGKIPWDKHYRETKELEASLRAKESEISLEREKIKNWTQDILKTFEENPYKAFGLIAKGLGKNPADYLKLYIAQSRKTLEELEGITQADLDARILAKKLEYEREELEEKKKALAQEEELRRKKAENDEVDRYFDEISKREKFSDEEIKSAINSLKEFPGSYDFTKMTNKQRADAVITEIRLKRHISKVEKGVSKVDPKLLKDKEFMGELYRITGPQDTVSDIVEVVKGYLGSNGSSQAGAQPQKSPATKPTGSTAQATSARKAAPQKADVDREFAVSGEDDDIGPLTLNDVFKWATKVVANRQS